MTPHSQLAGQQLRENDLLNVMEELADVRAKWYNIGLGLGLSVGTLDGIKADHSNTCDCLREALKTWLKTYLPPPTWSKVLEALRTKIVGEAKLAAYLEQKYCTALDTSTAAATPSPQSTVPTAPSYHSTQDTSTAAATPSPQSTVPTAPSYHSTQDTSTAAATPSPQSTVPTAPSYHPTLDTSTAAATPSPQSTVPTAPSYHPTQDTSTAAATLSPQSTVPTAPSYHPTLDTSAAATTQPPIPTTLPHNPVQGMPLVGSCI